MALFTVACSDRQPWKDQAKRASRADPVVAQKVDSLLPAGEALDRFLAGLPRTERLAGGARTRHDLVARLLQAIEQRDSTAIEKMALSRGEYGFLYYPTSVYSRKPYELAPDIAWMLASESSAKGARRLIQRLGGRQLALTGIHCRREHTEGSNKFWQQCEVSYRDAGVPEKKKLFHAIIERDSDVKFLSYAGDF